MLDILPNSEVITPEWLTAALKTNGVVDQSAVLSLEKNRIGEDEGFTVKAVHEIGG